MTRPHNERAGELQIYSDLPPSFLYALCSDTHMDSLSQTHLYTKNPTSLSEAVQHPTEYALLTKHHVDEIQSRTTTGKCTRHYVPNEETTTTTEKIRPQSSAGNKTSVNLTPHFCHKQMYTFS